MISPIHIVTIGLGIAFALGLVKKAGVNFSGILMLLGLAGMTFISAEWLYEFVFQAKTQAEIFTAGFKPPYSINLLMGKNEAVISLLISLSL